MNSSGSTRSGRRRTCERSDRRKRSSSARRVLGPRAGDRTGPDARRGAPSALIALVVVPVRRSHREVPLVDAARGRRIRHVAALHEDPRTKRSAARGASNASVFAETATKVGYPAQQFPTEKLPGATNPRRTVPWPERTALRDLLSTKPRRLEDVPGVVRRLRLRAACIDLGSIHGEDRFG